MVLPHSIDKNSALMETNCLFDTAVSYTSQKQNLHCTQCLSSTAYLTCMQNIK